jgi:hypothetical protein
MKNICICECHRQGREIMEFTPCCALCGRKYLNPDGSFDGQAYVEATKPETDGRKRKRRKHKV